MDIKKWKSVAIKLEDYLLLKAYCDEKYRAPASMISKLLHDYVKFRAEKEKHNKRSLFKKIIKKKKIMEFQVSTLFINKLLQKKFRKHCLIGDKEVF